MGPPRNTRGRIAEQEAQSKNLCRWMRKRVQGCGTEEAPKDWRNLARKCLGFMIGRPVLDLLKTTTCVRGEPARAGQRAALAPPALVRGEPQGEAEAQPQAAVQPEVGCALPGHCHSQSTRGGQASTWAAEGVLAHAEGEAQARRRRLVGISGGRAIACGGTEGCLRGGWQWGPPRQTFPVPPALTGGAQTWASEMPPPAAACPRRMALAASAKASRSTATTSTPRPTTTRSLRS